MTTDVQMNDQLKILLIFFHKICIVFFLFMFKAISQNYADFTPNMQEMRLKSANSV